MAMLCDAAMLKGSSYDYQSIQVPLSRIVNRTRKLTVVIELTRITIGLWIWRLVGLFCGSRIAGE